MFFHNFPIQEFYFLIIIYILLHTDMISSTYFQHLDIVTRASRHWCLAPTIVLAHAEVKVNSCKQKEPRAVSYVSDDLWSISTIVNDILYRRYKSTYGQKTWMCY